MSSTFKSEFLLTDEQMAAMGIAPHRYASYRGTHYMYSFSVETWCKGPLRDHTFQTDTVPLTFDEAGAMCRVYRVQQGYEKRTTQYDDDLAALQRVEDRLDTVLQDFPTGAFVKLNTRSPKDVPMDSREQALMDLVDEELDLIPDSERNENAEMIAFVKATNRSMRVETGSDVMKLFLASSRIHEDLRRTLDHGASLFRGCIIVREWLEDAVEHPEGEYRGFVSNGSLNAVTQYFCFLHFPELVANKDAIGAQLRAYHESIKEHIPHSSYVIDFLVLPDRIMIIELNPFHTGAGPGLFTWKDDRERFLNGPFEMRVLTEPDPTAQDGLRKFWKEHIEASRPKPWSCTIS